MAKTVLVINSGSSSIKYQLVDLGIRAKALPPVSSRRSASRLTAITSMSTTARSMSSKSPSTTTSRAASACSASSTRYGPKLADAGIVAVGHRVVQGGSIFPNPALVTDKTINQVKDLAVLAPLHNGPEAVGAEVMRALLPDVPQVFVFDSSFFFQLPKASSTYALNKEIADQYHIRRYGCPRHQPRVPLLRGSGRRRASRPKASSRSWLHIGNGASASAEISGKPVETSMGLTPLEGLMMGGRTGDIDPAVVFHLIRNAHMNVG